MADTAVGANDALTLAKLAGVKVTVDGDDLLLVASGPPPEELLAGLKRCKGQIFSLLASGAGWINDDLIEAYEERAAILQFDAGLSPAEAEREALALLCRSVF